MLTAGLSAAVALIAMTQQAKDITTRESHALLNKDSSVVLLDVRTPAEFRSETGHLANAILVPIQELQKRADELEPYRNRKIIAYCRTGNRSGLAAEILSKKGFTVMNMVGGIVQWNKEQLPVVFEKHE